MNINDEKLKTSVDEEWKLIISAYDWLISFPCFSCIIMFSFAAQSAYLSSTRIFSVIAIKKLAKNSSHIQWFASHKSFSLSFFKSEWFAHIIANSGIEPAKEIHRADHGHSVNQPWASSRNERVHHNENQLAHMETI